jgi:nitroreductase
MSTPFADLIRTRQSVREYQPRPVADDNLQRLIEAVRLAPSASNSQPWRLIIVNDPELKDRVARAAYSPLITFNRFALQAPVIAVLTIERPGLVTRIGARLKNREFPLIDIGIAAEHFCLQAAELGLGTCMIGWFDEDEVKRVLRIPAGTRVGLLISLGYAPEGYPLRRKIRKTTAEMSRFNTY